MLLFVNLGLLLFRELPIGSPPPDRLSTRGAKHPKPIGDAIERLQDPPLTPGQDLAPIGRFRHPFARPISQVNVPSSLRPMVGPAGFEPATKGL